jgi:hypothetical protein
MSLLAAIRKQMERGMKAVLYSLLLTIYITGSSRIDVLHQALHSHENFISHSQAQEKDPCHRSIYHKETSKGCGHHSHVVVSDTCELCDLISNADELLLADIKYSEADYFVTDYPSLSAHLVGKRISISSSRGPPSI